MFRLPPPEVVAAAELVGRWFSERNIRGWQLGPCRDRWYEPLRSPSATPQRADYVYNAEVAHCKHCSRDFRFSLGPRFSGDVFLVCPGCGWRHYRHFALGEAIHCDIARRHDDPVEVRGR